MCNYHYVDRDKTVKLHKNDFNSTDHVRGIWRARVTDTTWKRSLSGFFAAILLSIATQTFAAQSRNEGWDSVTAANATIPETFRGPSIYRGDIGAVQSLAFNPMDNPQSGNFHINIPLVQVPGRGNSLSINLSYNSQLWTSSVSQGETSSVRLNTE